VQGVCIAGIPRKRLAIQPVGFVQASLLVMANSLPHLVHGIALCSRRIMQGIHLIEPDHLS
jgi:hypothetical protein